MTETAQQEQSVKEYTTCVSFLFEILQEIESIKTALGMAVVEDHRTTEAFVQKQTNKPSELKQRIRRRVEAIETQFRTHLNREKPLLPQQAQRLRVQTMAAIRTIKEAWAEAEEQEEAPSLQTPAIRIQLEKSRQDLETILELAAENISQVKEELFTPITELTHPDQTPNLARFYRGTNLTRFLIRPGDLRLRKKEFKVAHFEPGIYPRVQCFSAAEFPKIAISHALNPERHGMFTLQNNHPHAVILELTINRAAIASLYKAEIMVDPNRVNEVLFDTAFLLKNASFRMFNPYEL